MASMKTRLSVSFATFSALLSAGSGNAAELATAKLAEPAPFASRSDAGKIVETVIAADSRETNLRKATGSIAVLGIEDIVKRRSAKTN